MRASLGKKKKRRDFLSKLAEGRKLSDPGETQWQREIKTVEGAGVRTKGGKEGKRNGGGYLGKWGMKEMLITEIVTDN